MRIDSATPPRAVRRITALTEVSKFQMGMKGGFNLVLVGQICSPGSICLSVAESKFEGWFSSISDYIEHRVT